MKTCRKCVQPKPEEEFSFRGLGKRRRVCRECMKGYKHTWDDENRERKRFLSAEYYRNHREQKDAANLAWRKLNPEKHRATLRRSQLKADYGMTPEDYDRMCKEQKGLCAACHEAPTGKGRAGKLHIDHIHGTKIVRELLCYGCNISLGYLRESPRKIDALAAYARKHLERAATPDIESNLIEFPASGNGR